MACAVFIDGTADGTMMEIESTPSIIKVPVRRLDSWYSYEIEEYELQSANPGCPCVYRHMRTTRISERGLVETEALVGADLRAGFPYPRYTPDRCGPDQHTVRFTEMSEEAEKEMQEWDLILKGKKDAN